MLAIAGGDKVGSIAPALIKAIAALSDAGLWATAFDTRWRYVAQSAEQASVTSADFFNGEFHFGPTLVVEGPVDGDLGHFRQLVRHLSGWMRVDLDLDAERLRAILHPALRDSVDLEPRDTPATAWLNPSMYLGDTIGLATVGLRVHDSGGQVVGTVLLAKPGVGMNTIAMLTVSADLEHLQRMQQLARPDRRAAAVLFADLEGSAHLSKRLPTAAYFKLVRRITRAADRCIIDAQGLVGRHAGDGVAAFFPVQNGSESDSARACISAARMLQASMRSIAEQHNLSAADLSVRFGLHWGSTLYIGSIVTPGRSEVTALGDAVNDAARIEACATGGRILASKDLVERLDIADAALLGVDTDNIVYTQLADLDTATDKARRDAPAIPVCDIATLATDGAP